MKIDKFDLGATGKFPEGKLNEQDKGEIRFAVMGDAKGNVVLYFGRDVTWIAMPPETAYELARLLQQTADGAIRSVINEATR